MKLRLAVLLIVCLVVASCGGGSPTSPPPPTTKYTLTVTISPTGGGSVAVSPSGTQFASGTQVTLTASAASGCSFTGWSGDASGSANPTTVSMNSNKNVTANFASSALPDLVVASLTHSPVYPRPADTITFVATVQNIGTGTAGASVLQFQIGGETPPTYNVPSLATNATYQVTRTAQFTVAQRYQVTGTADATQVVTESNENNNVTTDTFTVTTSPQYTLTVAASPSNGGTVTLSPSGGKYPSGTVVTLTATAASGYSFTGWQGDATGSTNPTTVTMNADKTVTANFASTTQYTLTVAASPSNGGSVTKNPNQTQYASGTVVTLTATAASGYTFTGWSGDASGTTNPTTVTMNANKTVTAVFTAATQHIQLSTSSLTFSATAGGASPAAQTVSITNGGSGTLSGLTITFPDGQPTWISATLSGGTAPATLTVTVFMTDPFGNPFGAATYTTRIAINSTVASNSPQYINVTFTILPPTNITAYPSYDNAVMTSSLDGTLANKVFSNSQLGVGWEFYYNAMYGYDDTGAASAIKFNVQSQISGRSIAKATLRLYVYALRGDFSVTPQIIVNAFQSDWNPGTLTWNTWMNLLHYTTGQASQNAPSSSSQPLDFDVTTIVKNWASGAWPIYGFNVYSVGPYYPGYTPSLQITYFQSLEYYSAANQRPQLIIVFQ